MSSRTSRALGLADHGEVGLAHDVLAEEHDPVARALDVDRAAHHLHEPVAQGDEGGGDVRVLLADGPGTSDLDLTLVGPEAVALYRPDGFFIPKVHSRPISEKDPDIAPGLSPLRDRLMKMVGRPVNIQGTRDWVMFVREHVMGQPYLTLCGKAETA